MTLSAYTSWVRTEQPSYFRDLAFISIRAEIEADRRLAIAQDAAVLARKGLRALGSHKFFREPDLRQVAHIYWPELQRPPQGAFR